jgi:dienelactone hydrolase
MAITRFLLAASASLMSLPARGGGPPATRPAVADPLEPIERAGLYFPRPYQPAEIRSFLAHGGIRLDYHTDQGNQSAWLTWPTRPDVPARLWVVFGGNAARAIDMVMVRRAVDRPMDAFLFVDYPGYGACQGLPDPESVRANVVGSVRSAATRVGLDVDRHAEAVVAFGHSLGCAAALMAVHEFHLRSVILCAPFTSTREMSELRFGLPAKGAPFHHQFDNRPPLAEMNTSGGRAFVFHGAADEVIPVQMSKTLAAEDDAAVRLKVIPGAHHNDLITRAQHQIAAAAASIDE